MTHFFAISVIGILVIFQPEIRQGLAKLGQQKIFKGGLYEEELKEIIAQIISAVDILSRKKLGP